MTTSNPNETYPSAPAILVLGAGDWDFRWRVLYCPLCGRTHYHGGGSLSGDPRRLLTHRVSHCLKRDLKGNARNVMGYILVDKDPKRTIRMLEELE